MARFMECTQQNISLSCSNVADYFIWWANETGSFLMDAKEENGEVVIHITKLYKQKNVSREKWNEMLAFIDAAYNSSFNYILLIPKQ